MHLADAFIRSDLQEWNKAIRQGASNIRKIQWQVYLTTRLVSKLDLMVTVVCGEVGRSFHQRGTERGKALESESFCLVVKEQ